MSSIINTRDGVLSYVDESGQERRIDFGEMTLGLPPEVKREGHYAAPGVSSWTFHGEFELTPPGDGRGGNARDRRRWRRQQRAWDFVFRDIWRDAKVVVRDVVLVDDYHTLTDEERAEVDRLFRKWQSGRP